MAWEGGVGREEPAWTGELKVGVGSAGWDDSLTGPNG